MVLPKIQYSRLRFYHFVDKDDQELGTLEDLILHPQSLIPTHIILGGGFFEEFMEDKGEIEDIDEIAPLDLVDHIDNDFIVLSTKLEELQTTDENGGLPVDGYKYSEFNKFKLIDEDGSIDAEIFDFLLDFEESAVLINHIGIEKELRQLGYFQKFEIMVPIKQVKIEENGVLMIKTSTSKLVEKIQDDIEPKQTGRSRLQL